MLHNANGYMLNEWNYVTPKSFSEKQLRIS